MPRIKKIPVILIDNREQLNYDFYGYDVTTMPATLHTGDYSIAIQKGEELIKYDNEIAIERKTLENWVCDISDYSGRERIEASILKGSKLRYYAIFIEAGYSEVMAHEYVGRIVPQAVWDTAIRWSVKYKIPIEFCENRTMAEYRTYEVLMGFLDYKKRGIL